VIWEGKLRGPCTALSFRSVASPSRKRVHLVGMGPRGASWWGYFDSFKARRQGRYEVALLGVAGRGSKRRIRARSRWKWYASTKGKVPHPKV